MIAFFTVEANQSGAGKRYRLVFGCGMHPGFISAVLFLSRLF